MINVIHVDNSGFFRKVMKVFLTELGFFCESFDRGEDVLDAVETRKVSCVITGLELLDMTGEDLIKKLLFAGHPMTIIAVTSSGDEVRIQRLTELGVKATIQKGSDWKEKLREYL
ncbi:MAG: response regulator [Treponema sp.]|jgi:FixJ family two-component response regulator|nr:response regulator [Treponema sp.]